MGRPSREDRVGRGVHVRDATYLGYLRRVFARCGDERVHATFVGPNLAYIADEILVEGQRDGVELGGRRLLERAFAHAARGVILAHNHPSGSSEPSLSDIRATKALMSLMEQVDVKLIDHLVVARHCVTSMREGGYL